MQKTARLLGFTLTALLSAAASKGARADTNWANSFGDWFIASNWDNGIPGILLGPQQAYITNNGTALMNRLVDTGFGVGPAFFTDLHLGFLKNTSGTLLMTNSGGAAAASMQLQSLWVGEGGLPGSGTGATGTLSVANGASIVVQASCFMGICNGGYLRIASGSQATGTTTINGSGSIVRTDALILGGATSNGTLNVLNGAHLETGYAELAPNVGGTGSATITGAGSSFIASSNLLVGGTIGGSGTVNGGSGVLHITSGGYVQAANVRFFDGGLLEVENGSTTVAGLRIVGGTNEPGPGGTLGDLAVAVTTAGRMEILTGGKLASKRGYIGFGSGSDGAVIVSGAGSRWDCTGSLWSGNGGVGSLEITDGGVVTSAGNGYLAFSNITSGYVRVSDAGSSLSYAGDLYIGGNAGGPGGSGTFQMENGAVVSANTATLYPGAYLVLGGSPTLNAPLSVNGANIQANADATFTNSFTVGAGGVYVHTSTYNVTLSGQISGVGGLTKVAGGFTSPDPGTLTLPGTSNYTGGTVVNAGSLVVDGSITSDVTVNNSATLAGKGAVGSVTVNSGGIVAPGDSPGKLTVNGNYNQTSGGILDMQIGGSIAGDEYDQLEITGTAVLGGTLNLALVNGFRPTVGDTFTILTSSDTNGSFSTINSSGFATEPDMTGSGVMLTVTSVDPLLEVIAVTRSDSELVITFQATGGKTYRLERTADIVSAAWDGTPDVEDLTVAANGPAQLSDLAPLSSPAFYRVRLLP